MTASANVELVRSIFAAWERGDWSSAEWAHPEIELVMGPDAPDPGSWKGLAEMAAGMREFLSTWEEYRIEANEYRELDSERVLVFATRRGRGKRSGLELGEMQEKGAVLFHIRDGRVTTLVGYFDRERALADVGLASKPRSSHA